jgi:hypothetical protein
MDDEIKEAVTYLSQTLKVLLSLCTDYANDDEETLVSLEEISDAKTKYEDLLRAKGVLPPLVDDEPQSAPMDLVSLAESMSAPDADEHQDGQ